MLEPVDSALQWTSQVELTYFSFTRAALQRNIRLWHSFRSAEWRITFSYLCFTGMHIWIHLSCTECTNRTIPVTQSSLLMFLSHYCFILCFTAFFTPASSPLPLWIYCSIYTHISTVKQMFSLCLIKILADTSSSDLAVFSRFLSVGLFSCCALFPVSF